MEAMVSRADAEVLGIQPIIARRKIRNASDAVVASCDGKPLRIVCALRPYDLDSCTRKRFICMTDPYGEVPAHFDASVHASGQRAGTCRNRD
jgi:hypothetical protein